MEKYQVLIMAYMLKVMAMVFSGQYKVRVHHTDAWVPWLYALPPPSGKGNTNLQNGGTA